MTELRPAGTPKRTVSFGPTDTVTLQAGPSSLTPPSFPPPTPSNATTTSVNSTPATNGTRNASSVGSVPMSASSSATGIAGTSLHPASSSPSTSTLKSAMKPGRDRKRLPPPEQYQHPDPLLRRLRLVDAHGVPVDLRREFRDTKVVGFYFASQWAGQPLKEYHQAISDFCRAHPHEFKAIYVSVDVDEQWYKAGVKDKPWISMVWNDGSSMPTERTDRTASLPNGDLDELPRLYNNEDFLLANESDIDESLSHTDKSGEAYLRPFSRVHLAAKLNIIAAPTLCIYHLETGKMLEWNVRMGRLASHRSKETWIRWQNAEKAASFGLLDVLQAAPYTFLIALVAVIYLAVVHFAGDEYNVLRNLLHKYAGDHAANQAQDHIRKAAASEL